ncbi:hypothetical protein ANCCEY_07609 [Ancylostoma ceylanicum]|uniref:WAP domain-containing protein n=2 Tax=Ancylostoma ceylanicum TaxID=53326 RepID=A0A0D6LTE8_9BILA|nr:hypothetical protein ANCCEY_07609 [Ancylostoma ceylanicum]EYC26844.1 hypothetical protein Y032_0010g994 [Ancylostoma ceylanicum]
MVQVDILLVFADLKCTTDNDCPAGTKCSEQICVARTDCPMRAPLKTPAGCKVEQYLDGKKCPMHKVVCP